MSESPHIPVLPREVIDLLQKSEVTEPQWFLDGTAGEGGHSKLILQTFPKAKLILIDRDAVMLERAKKEIQSVIGSLDRVHSFQMNFSEVDKELLESLGCPGLDGALVDLGVSLFHFLHSGRGFTFKNEEPLDMRLEPQVGRKTAADIVNYSTVLHLKKVFWEYGEERWALKVANNIVQSRHKKKFETNTDLVKLVEASIPRKFWPKESHPATKIFQALRIEVNEELLHAEKGIRNIAECLKLGGVLACISFHSLEDRIVKWTFRDLKTTEHFEILTKKPILPTDTEIKENRASRSAKLRGLQRINPIINQRWER
ncbi:16S rRNA (cytosine(1402)-N(4))-methyltransferase RsmH [Leptospira meyeri]|uniref:Ribosomal RNA small subunit methyltransferase H n=1 Tax=Leptospira meyeri TaxID=29508 RepID=A0A4R8MVM7_LEPME|nr:16S rRNA (cytosine(1402)-N(4))-methyltransferase RsmH [Leptospira meyeri]EKJ85349.1 16S rRNA (cytosine(1402)-N(4))-methyltransferase [Leptospira meyeri serovar Hardjo str. Went 5]EMJ87168.1 16S rRNA (cytosine(1402)-N(4))-methyltransferase [Leptospira meyeri serovar Semaranga str. Veldrot Semarang 173]TDY71482.1 16S rRNA (cytosine1402-N4)-methyltransferase [Leptospira meyeri]TGL45749.1 16S rRNA (cytosine(1402)-N(4))-methyltransferase RsmH [Leptospira meyeri]